MACCYLCVASQSLLYASVSVKSTATKDDAGLREEIMVGTGGYSCPITPQGLGTDTSNYLDINLQSASAKANCFYCHVFFQRVLGTVVCVRFLRILLEMLLDLSLNYGLQQSPGENHASKSI